VKNVPYCPELDHGQQPYMQTHTHMRTHIKNRLIDNPSAALSRNSRKRATAAMRCPSIQEERAVSASATGRRKRRDERETRDRCRCCVVNGLRFPAGRTNERVLFCLVEKTKTTAGSLTRWHQHAVGSTCRMCSPSHRQKKKGVTRCHEAGTCGCNEATTVAAPWVPD
jgi:hypothetical protein